jgi:adenosine deaminase
MNQIGASGRSITGTSSTARYELHCHLDCALRPQTIAELAQAAQLRLSRPVRELCIAPFDTGSLTGFLPFIDLAIDLLQTPESLRRAARELIEDWHDDRVIYGEMRFAPQLHTRADMTVDDAILAVAAGIDDATRTLPVHAALLLCCLRHQPVDVSLLVADAAVRHRGTVVGLDLAGDERFSGKAHREAVALAREGGLPVTVHAGEAAGPESIWEAIEVLGARRIGHGVRCITDLALVRRLVDDRITLETCPRCNVLTGAVSSMADHPIDALLNAGVLVTVSTDARTTANTSLDREFEALVGTFGWSSRQLDQVQTNARSAAFGTLPPVRS